MSIIASPLYIRVIPADRDRDYILLLSWTKPVNRRTAHQSSTLSAPTRDSLNSIISAFTKMTKVTEIIDMTDNSIKKQLAKIFGEIPEPTVIKE